MATLKTTKTALAEKLGISRSTLYYRPKKPVSDEEAKRKIIAVMAEHPAYGTRRIAWALGVNRKHAKRLMQKYGLKPRIRREFRPVKSDDLGRPETRVVNVLKTLCPLRAGVVWAGDFTYFWFVDRFWYLATVIDVHTREIVGWHIANHHTASLIMEAFNDAVQRTSDAPAYFHSDQGSEYVSEAYETLLRSCGTIPSQSTKASPWQNGFQESFYSNFKLELGKLIQFNHIGGLIEVIHRQIHYYNCERIHSVLRMPPTTFRKHCEEQRTTVPFHSILQNALLGKSV